MQHDGQWAKSTSWTSEKEVIVRLWGWWKGSHSREKEDLSAFLIFACLIIWKLFFREFQMHLPSIIAWKRCLSDCRTASETSSTHTLHQICGAMADNFCMFFFLEPWAERVVIIFAVNKYQSFSDFSFSAVRSLGSYMIINWISLGSADYSSKKMKESGF